MSYISTFIISVLVILLLHNIYKFLKQNLTQTKLKDLTSIMKAQNNEPTPITIDDPTTAKLDNKKKDFDELDDFLKQELNDDNGETVLENNTANNTANNAANNTANNAGNNAANNAGNILVNNTANNNMV